MHYRRWHLYGDASYTTRTPPQPGRGCSVADCERAHEAFGYCRLHYRRFQKYGSAELPVSAPATCRTCGGPVKAQGLCDKHYQRWRKHGDVENDGHRPLAVRLQERLVRTDSGCLEWTGATLRGYGQIGVNGKVLYAHRVSYELAYGPIPDGMDICHRCDNPPCCAPEHLFAGTMLDNMADMISKNRGWWQRGDREGSGRTTDASHGGDAA